MTNKTVLNLLSDEQILAILGECWRQSGGYTMIDFARAVLSQAHALLESKSEQPKCDNCGGTGGFTLDTWVDPVSGPEAHAEKCEVCNGSGIELPGPLHYTPGTWFNARTLDEMQAFYLSRLPIIREAAKEHGYAIGLHGSTRRDFDLMAMQWRDDASDKDTLAHAIAMAACGITRDGAYQWERKPSRRFAVSIPICWTDHENPEFDKPSIGHIDLSIIDLAAADHPLQEFVKGEA